MSLLNSLATQSQVENSPSNKDGISHDLELSLRRFGALLIQQASYSCELSQSVKSTACVLYQRFYYVSSFRNFGAFDTSLACLFLASKLEENPIRIRDLVNVYDYMLHYISWRRTHSSDEDERFVYEPMGFYEDRYYTYRDECAVGEMQVLKRLGFHASVLHSHAIVVNYLQVLSLVDHPTIPQDAWSLLNDSLLTPLPAIHPPTLLAASAIYIASRMADPPEALPLAPKPWWELMDVESEEEMKEAGKMMLDSRLVPGGMDIWEWMGTIPKGKYEVREWLERERGE